MDVQNEQNNGDMMLTWSDISSNFGQDSCMSSNQNNLLSSQAPAGQTTPPINIEFKHIDPDIKPCCSKLKLDSMTDFELLELKPIVNSNFKEKKIYHEATPSGGPFHVRQ